MHSINSSLEAVIVFAEQFACHKKNNEYKKFLTNLSMTPKKIKLVLFDSHRTRWKKLDSIHNGNGKSISLFWALSNMSGYLAEKAQKIIFNYLPHYGYKLYYYLKKKFT
jgi:hypothetical protein